MCVLQLCWRSMLLLPPLLQAYRIKLLSSPLQALKVPQILPHRCQVNCRYSNKQLSVIYSYYTHTYIYILYLCMHALCSIKRKMLPCCKQHDYESRCAYVYVYVNRYADIRDDYKIMTINAADC